MSKATNATPLGFVTESEIASQPKLWRDAAALARHGNSGLPKDGENVLVLGCGTSYYVGAAYASIRETAGLGNTDAAIASDHLPNTRSYDRIIAISRSGTSSDLVEALERIGNKVPITAILGELGTPIESLATEVIDFSFADEASVVQTRFPTSLLTYLRTHLGMDHSSLQSLIDSVSTVLNEPLLPAPERQLVILGTRWASFLAQEAALKCRESAGIWSEAYSTGEFRHGPISTAEEGTLVWAISPLSEVEAEAITSTGATLHQGIADPQVELVNLQRHAVKWARLLGRDADSPRHLSRSVI